MAPRENFALVYTDLDEFILPKKSLGWAGMMTGIENFNYGSYLFRHSYFFQNYDNTDLDISPREPEYICNGSHRVNKNFQNFAAHGGTCLRQLQMNFCPADSSRVQQALRF